MGFRFHYIFDIFVICKMKLNQFDYIVVMSDHISKCLNSLVFDHTFCQDSHEL